MPRIIQATRKNISGTVFEIMYVHCPESNQEHSEAGCDIRYCKYYEGRKEVVKGDILQIACGFEN